MKIYRKEKKVDYNEVMREKYKAKVNEMKFTKENVEKVIDEYFWQADFEPCGDLIAEIRNLDDTPEKVVVPKFVAEWIEFNRSKGVRLSNLLACYREIRDNPSELLGKADDAGDWYVNNPYKLVKAFVEGYEVEKEPLYCVNINGQYLVKMIPERNVHKFVEEEKLCVWDTQAYQLTEAEIKKIDERYIPFMVPVDEVNND